MLFAFWYDVVLYYGKRCVLYSSWCSRFLHSWTMLCRHSFRLISTMALRKRSQQYIHCSFIVTSIHPSITITNHEIRTEAMCRLKKRERETDGSPMKSFISIRTNHSLLIPNTEVSRDYFYGRLVEFLRRLTEQFVPFQHYDMELRYRRLAFYQINAGSKATHPWNLPAFAFGSQKYDQQPWPRHGHVVNFQPRTRDKWGP